jgi:hypothetical protein
VISFLISKSGAPIQLAIPDLNVFFSAQTLIVLFRRYYVPFTTMRDTFRSGTVQWESALGNKLKSLQKGATTLLEALQRNLLITPPSHFSPQKVEG